MAMSTGAGTTDRELLVMRALRLKGRATTDSLAAATGLPDAEAGAIAARLVVAGEAREANGNLMLMPPGRERLNGMLDEERAHVDAEAMNVIYEGFHPVNSDFKQLASAWQMRDGELNDHTDAVYDQSVLDQLPAIHGRLMPVVSRSAQLAPRLEAYKQRFATALQKAQGGEHEWLLKPLIDSYHTVWFEFHEDLIGLTGRTREDEAASGRAE